MIIAQVHDRRLPTNAEIRMTTSAGAVVGLMGSDEQFKPPEFPVVLVYNRVNHFLPTAPLSDDSLLNWQLSVTQQCLDGAYEFYLEAQPKMYKEPELNEKLGKLFTDYVDFKHMLRGRAELGTTAATSTPMFLTGRKPKRSDTIGRWGEIPSKSQRVINMQQPFFENELDNPALPPYKRRELEEKEKLKSSNKPATSTHQTVTVTVQETSTSQPTTTSFMPVSNVAPTAKSVIVSLPLPPSGTQQSGPPSKRQKRNVVNKPIIETDTIDDEDADITYVPDEEEEEDDDNGDGQEQGETSSSSSLHHHLASQETSIKTGIPKLPSKRKVADETKKKYQCKVCSKRFSRSSELRDHTYTKHLGCSYDCTDCLKTYATKKALKYHNDSIHGGKAGVHCKEEGCKWEAKDVGKLHEHLLSVNGIGDPIVCNVIETGKKCNKVFKNTRSFQAHAALHMEKKLKCEICDRYFSTTDKIRAHVRKYHTDVENENKYQCELCGNILDSENQYNHHKRLHMLQHHEMLKQLGEKPPKASKTARGSAPSSTAKDTPAPPPAAPAPPPPSETKEAGSTTQAEHSVSAEAEQSGSKTAEADLKLIGHLTVVTKKEEEDLEATLHQIAEEEEAAAKTKEQEQQDD